jgi:hypothetical protein
MVERAAANVLHESMVRTSGGLTLTVEVFWPDSSRELVVHVPCTVTSGPAGLHVGMSRRNVVAFHRQTGEELALTQNEAAEAYASAFELALRAYLQG